MSYQTLPLTPALLNYLNKHNPEEHPHLSALRAETQATLEAAPMQIAREQGHFLQLLIHLIQANRVIEIGTFTGYSSACMALALPEKGTILCCDTSYDWTRLAVKYWKLMGVDHKITLRLNPAISTLQHLLDEGQGESFDMIFIDADKPNYLNYYELSLALLKPKGLIAIDNVLWDSLVIDESDQKENTVAIRALNDQIAKDKRVMHCIIPIADGLTLAIKKSALTDY